MLVEKQPGRRMGQSVQQEAVLNAEDVLDRVEPDRAVVPNPSGEDAAPVFQLRHDQLGIAVIACESVEAGENEISEREDHAQYRSDTIAEAGEQSSIGNPHCAPGSS